MSLPEKVFYEHCIIKWARKGNLIPVEELVGKVGYRSVYGFDEGTSLIVRARKHSRDFHQFPLYAEWLLVDFDDQPEEAMKLKNFLVENDIQYGLYDSGNRSYHFHIPHEPKFSKDLPYSHLKLLERMGLNMSKVDTSIYRPNSIFRLTGTRHTKTGKKKVLLEENTTGVLLDFDLVETPPKHFGDTGEGEKDLFYLANSILQFEVDPPLEGNRYPTLFALGCACKDSGLSESATFEILSKFNESFDDPKCESEVKRATRGAFAR